MPNWKLLRIIKLKHDLPDNSVPKFDTFNINNTECLVLTTLRRYNILHKCVWLTIHVTRTARSTVYFLHINLYKSRYIKLYYYIYYTHAAQQLSYTIAVFLYTDNTDAPYSLPYLPLIVSWNFSRRVCTGTPAETC